MGKHSPQKWPRHKSQYMPWWDGLTIDEKVAAKAHFLKVRDWNAAHNHCPYPDMWNIADIRISQLTEKHIYRIWVFRDHPSDRQR